MSSISHTEQHQLHPDANFFEKHGVDTGVHWSAAFVALFSAATALGIFET
jgi:hypothetical protein